MYISLLFLNILNLCKNVLTRDLQRYGLGYYIIWMFYSDLYVIEKIETYTFDFDTALVAVGGSMGLFLGWSCNSIVLWCIDVLYQRVSD